MVLLTSFSAIYWLTLPPQTARPLAVATCSIAALSAGLGLWVRTWSDTDPRIHVVASSIGFLIAAKCFLHIWLVRQPAPIASLVLVTMLGGCIAFRRTHYVALTSFIAAGVCISFLQFADSPDWLYLSAVAAASAVIGLVVLLFRVQLHEELCVAHRVIFENAHYDPLTGLADRELLIETLRPWLADRARGGPPFAVCYIDLDGFKGVNDQFGHHAGDLILATVGKRLRSHPCGDDFAARIGGDEFVVLVRNVPVEVQPAEIVTRLRSAVSGTVRYGRHDIPASASVGCIWPEPQRALTPEQAIALADKEMYADKKARGRSRTLSA
ncbi:MAG: GGDEF domain-containing protein [Acidobacteria bacterium]|nr:GGDEF domain-containing protein [Acidobacteriota bacterium]